MLTQANKAPKLAAATFLFYVLQTSTSPKIRLHWSHISFLLQLRLGWWNSIHISHTQRGSEAASELRHTRVHLECTTSNYTYFCLYTSNSNVHLYSIRNSIGTNLLNIPIKNQTFMCLHMHVVPKIYVNTSPKKELSTLARVTRLGLQRANNNHPIITNLNYLPVLRDVIQTVRERQSPIQVGCIRAGSVFFVLFFTLNNTL